MYNILIADTRRVVRAGLCTIFIGNDLVGEIREAQTSEDVAKQIAMLSPDLIFIHQSLLPKTETHALQQTSYVVLASEPNLHVLYSAYQNNARGYISENASTELFLLALRVEDDTFLLDPTLASWLLKTTSCQHLAFVSVDTLTEREQEIFDLMRSGMSNNEIGQNLCISLTTVKKHAANISQKLNLKRRSMKILSLPYHDTAAQRMEQRAISL